MSEKTLFAIRLAALVGHALLARETFTTTVLNIDAARIAGIGSLRRIYAVHYWRDLYPPALGQPRIPKQFNANRRL